MNYSEVSRKNPGEIIYRSKFLEISKEIYEHTLICMYIRYIYHQNMFIEHVHPSLRLLKIWGILAWFGDIWDGVLQGKCHNLKNICKIDKKRIWFYHFRHEGTIWATKKWDDLYIFGHFLDPCGRLRRNWPIKWLLGTILLASVRASR